MKTGVAFFAKSAPLVTWNPSDKNANITLSSGNLVATRNSGTPTYAGVRATGGKDASDKGYFEVAITAMEAGAPYIVVGIATGAAALNYPGEDAYGWSYYAQTGDKITNGATSSYGSTFAQGDVIGVAFNNGKVWFAKNNTWNGSPTADTGAAFTGISGTVYPMVGLYDANGPLYDQVTARFKSSSFSYSPPSGFSAWGPE